jgi:hypothetical protein
MHAIIARDDIHPDAKPKPTRDSRASHVVPATADRGVPAPAHADVHAHAHAHAGQTSNTRGFDSLSDRPTDGSARTPSLRAKTFAPTQKQKSTTLHRDGGTHVLLASLLKPPPTVA